MRIINWIIGSKIKTYLSLGVVVLILGTASYWVVTYKNAIKDAERFKVERDKLVIEGVEQRAYTAHLVAQNDSLNNVIGVDKRNYDNTVKDLQSLIQQQRGLIKEKDILIGDMRKNLKCKNVFGKIVDC